MLIGLLSRLKTHLKNLIHLTCTGLCVHGFVWFNKTDVSLRSKQSRARSHGDHLMQKHVGPVGIP